MGEAMKRIFAGFFALAVVWWQPHAAAAPFAYVANNSSGNVSVIDVATNTVVATVPVGANPNGVGVNSAGTRAYVTNGGGNTVSVIDSATNTVVSTIAVGTTPFSVAVNPAGTAAYVANFGANSVSVINTATNTVTATIPVGMAPTSIAVHPAGTRVYVGNQNSQNVSVIDTSTNTVIATVPIGGVATGLAVHPDGSRVFVVRPAASSNTIFVIDTATNTTVGSFSSGTATNNDTQVLSVNIAGTRIYAANQNSSTVTVLDSTSGALLATIPVGTSPHGISFEPSGARAFVASSGANNVSVIDTGTNTVITAIPVGTAPFSSGIFIARVYGPLVAPSITSAMPPGGTVGSVYTHTFASTGTVPIAWSVISGAIPPGLTLNSANGVLSGTPLASGSYSFTVQASNGVAPNASQAVTVAIAALTPIFSPSATSFDFGNVLVTTTATPQSLTITNLGTANLNISSASLTGASPSDYSVSATPCPMPIPPLSTCVIPIGFSPLGQGVRNALLTLTSDAAGSPHAITLTGTGILPAATYSPGSLDFGSLAVGITSASQQVTFTNTSSIVLSLSNISFTGGGAGFNVLPTSQCLMSPMLAPAGSCTFDITATPTATGSLTDTVYVGTSPANAATPASVALTVIGLAPPAPTLTVAFAPASVVAGVNSTLTFTLTNSFSLPASISLGSSVAVSGLTLTSLTDSCGLGAFISTGSVDFGMAGIIPALASCTVTVQAQSTAAGMFTVTAAPGNLITNRGNNANTSTATLAVAAAIPTVVLSNASLGFGLRTVNTTSPSQTVTLTNGGTGNLVISSINVTGDFAFTTNCPISTPPIAPTAPACSIIVTFTPLTVAPLTGSIVITSNAPTSPHTILLTGTGTAAPAPAIALSATGLSLGPTVVNTLSTPQGVTVTNTGFANLVFSAISVTGAGIARVTPASVTPANCGTSVAPSGTCQIAVACTPVAAGTFTGQISIAHNAAGSPSIVNVVCIGSPVPVAVLAVNPLLDFGDQVVNTASTPRPVNLANTGTAPLTISRIALSGADAGQFSVSGACATVAAGASCDVMIGFAPTSTGAKAAFLDVASNAQNASTANRVALAGIGVLAQRPIAVLGATAVGFGNTIFGGASPTQLVSFKNDGGLAMTISGITTVGDFSQMNNCGGILGSLATCSINVAFNPLGQGNRVGELRVFSNAQGSPHRVVLSGTGCRWFSQAGSRFFLTAC